MSKYVQIFTNSGVKAEKKRVFIAKSAKKQFLLTNSGVITSTLGVSGLELHSSGTGPVTFFGTLSSLRGHNSRLGGHVPGMLPRGAGPAVSNCLSDCPIKMSMPLRSGTTGTCVPAKFSRAEIFTECGRILMSSENC